MTARHVWVPAPDDDVLGTASACCPLPEGNRRVHIDPSELPEAPPDHRYEAPEDPEPGTLGKEQLT